MPGHLLNSATKTMLEGFVNPDDTAQKKNSYVELAALIIAFVLSLLIISLIGKLLHICTTVYAESCSISNNFERIFTRSSSATIDHTTINDI